jgi:type I restriction enzyme S subunit
MAGEWRQVSIGALCDAGVAELQTGPFGTQLHAYDYVDDGVPVVPTEAIRDRQIDHSVLPKITRAKAQELERHRLQSGDILFARRGVQATGHIGCVRTAEDGFICGTGAIRLRVTRASDTIDPDYLSHVLANPSSVEWFKFHAIGATMPNLNEGIIRSFPLSVPSLPEQRAIAHILGTLDDKIELNRRMNETLEAMARALFKSWFVDFDPVRAKAEGRDPGLTKHIADLFPDMFEDSELGEIPRGWFIRQIRDNCSQIQNGGTPRRDEPRFWDYGVIPWLTSGEVRQPIITITENVITEAGLAGSSAKWISPLSTVIALYGATAGQVSLISSKLTTNQAVCALIPKKNCAFFNYLWMRAETPALESKAVGSAQQNISKGIVEETEVIQPPSEVLERFTELVKPIFDLWIGSLGESRTLAALRDTLLPKLISGELRVKDAERFVNAQDQGITP